MNAITTITSARLRLTIKLVIVGLACLWGNATLAATLSLSPSTGVYSAGQNFTERVVVNTAGAAINAAEGTLSFKPSEITVVSISKGTTFNLWTSEPSFSNSAGTINFSGGTPTGYTGNGGTVLTITFKAKAAGSPRVNFASGAVLAADGRGTNVLTGMNGGSFTISAPSISPVPETIIEYIPPANTPAAPVVKSTTHSDQSRWYTEKKAVLSWLLSPEVTAVRTLLDERATSVPSKVYDTPIDTITIDALEEGVQYFHIQFKNADGWGKVSHYRLAVDTVAPTKFVVSLEANADLSSPEQKLVITAEDASSEVKRFKVQLDGNEPFEITNVTASSTILLPKLTPGYHTVVVEGFDEAGNSGIDSLSFSILAFDKPQFFDVPTRISEGVIPVFSGVTRSNADVIVILAKLGTDPQETTVRSNEAGEFSFIPEAKLAEGVYELSARAIDQYGAQSEDSDIIRVVVEPPGIIRIGSLLVDVLSVIVPLVVLAVFLIFISLYALKRLRSLKLGVAREAKEAVAILEREFASLTQSVLQHGKTLKAGRKTNRLTKAEQELLDTLSASLVSAKLTIIKEITDVEDIVE